MNQNNSESDKAFFRMPVAYFQGHTSLRFSALPLIFITELYPVLAKGAFLRSEREI